MIVKDRYIIPKDNLKIELDIYQGILEGLIIMEVEFNNEIEAINFKLDGFDVIEVTNDINYKNKTLGTKVKINFDVFYFTGTMSLHRPVSDSRYPSFLIKFI